jgi:cytochrome c1
MAYIRDPKSQKPNARMPTFPQIKDEDLRALAEYLASLK